MECALLHIAVHWAIRCTQSALQFTEAAPDRTWSRGCHDPRSRRLRGQTGPWLSRQGSRRVQPVANLQRRSCGSSRLPPHARLAGGMLGYRDGLQVDRHPGAVRTGPLAGSGVWFRCSHRVSHGYGFRRTPGSAMCPRTMPVQRRCEAGAAGASHGWRNTRCTAGNGGPDTIRTYDLPLRRGTLYPAELRGRDEPVQPGDSPITSIGIRVHRGPRPGLSPP